MIVTISRGISQKELAQINRAEVRYKSLLSE
jgi:hypothetical protein